MRNYIKDQGVKKLPEVMPKSFKKPEVEIFFLNCVLKTISVHFGDKNDSLQKHRIYVDQFYKSINLLYKYFQYIDPAYFEALRESISFLLKNLQDDDIINKIKLLKEGVLIFHTASDELKINAPSEFTPYRILECQRLYTSLAEQYVDKMLKFKKEINQEFHLKPYLLILKDLYTEAARETNEEFIKEMFKKRANFCQKSYDDLFKTGNTNWLAFFYGQKHKKLCFENADLKGANLKNMNLMEAKFKNVHLEGADLSKAILNNVFFEDTRLEKANLENASLVGARFKNVDLEGADLSRAVLDNAIFEDTKLEKANLENASLVEPKSKDVHLENGDISELRLYDETSKNLSVQEIVGTASFSKLLPLRTYSNFAYSDGFRNRKVNLNFRGEEQQPLLAFKKI